MLLCLTEGWGLDHSSDEAKQSLESGFPANQLNVGCWLTCLHCPAI